MSHANLLDYMIAGKHELYQYTEADQRRLQTKAADQRRLQTKAAGTSLAVQGSARTAFTDEPVVQTAISEDDDGRSTTPSAAHDSTDADASGAVSPRSSAKRSPSPVPARPSSRVVSSPTRQHAQALAPGPVQGLDVMELLRKPAGFKSSGPLTVRRGNGPAAPANPVPAVPRGTKPAPQGTVPKQALVDTAAVGATAEKATEASQAERGTDSNGSPLSEEHDELPKGSRDRDKMDRRPVQPAQPEAVDKPRPSPPRQIDSTALMVRAVVKTCAFFIVLLMLPSISTSLAALFAPVSQAKAKAATIPVVGAAYEVPAPTGREPRLVSTREKARDPAVSRPAGQDGSAGSKRPDDSIQVSAPRPDVSGRGGNDHHGQQSAMPSLPSGPSSPLTRLHYRVPSIFEAREAMPGREHTLTHIGPGGGYEDDGEDDGRDATADTADWLVGPGAANVGRRSAILPVPHWARAQLLRPGAGSIGQASGYNAPQFEHAHLPFPPSWAIVQASASKAAGQHVRDTVMTTDGRGNAFGLWEVGHHSGEDLGGIDAQGAGSSDPQAWARWLEGLEDKEGKEGAGQDGQQGDSIPTEVAFAPTAEATTGTVRAPAHPPRPLAGPPGGMSSRLAHGLTADQARQEAVKEAFVHAWTGYKAHAWGHDQLKPCSRSHDDPLGGLGATLVDSLDTLLIMGLGREYLEAETAALDTVKLTAQEDVNLFETTIRVLGGLLSAYELTNRTRHALVERAQHVGESLLFGFDSPSGIPYGTLGMRSRRKYNPSWVAGSTLAEVGTLQMEWEHLSAVTGEPKFANAARRALASLLAVEPLYDSLWPTFLNPEDGTWSSTHVTLGARGDSAWEYLLKYPLLAGAGRAGRDWATVYRPAGRAGEDDQPVLQPACEPDPSHTPPSDPTQEVCVVTGAGDGEVVCGEEAAKLVGNMTATGEAGACSSYSVPLSSSLPHDLVLTVYHGPVGNPALLGNGRRVDRHGDTAVASFAITAGLEDLAARDGAALDSAAQAALGLLEDLGQGALPARPVPVQAYSPPHKVAAGRAWAAAGTSDALARYARYEFSAQEMMARAGVGHDASAGGQFGTGPGRTAPGAGWTAAAMPPFHPAAHLASGAVSSPSSEASWFTSVLGAFWRSTAGLMHGLVKLSGADSGQESHTQADGEQASGQVRLAGFESSIAHRPAWVGTSLAEGGPPGRYYFLAERQGSGDVKEVHVEHKEEAQRPGEPRHIALHYPATHTEGKQDHLACFMPGLLGLAGTVAPAPALAARSLSLARALMRTCMRTYTMTETGLAPEIVRFTEGSPGSGASGEPFTDGGSRHSLLRPETVESLFVMYRVTGDEAYRDWGWRIFTAINSTARVPEGGFSSVRDVHAVPTPGSCAHLMDSQETFFLAETLKYLYLLFSASEDEQEGQELPDGSGVAVLSRALPLDRWVFNTEAHPLPVWPQAVEAVL